MQVLLLGASGFIGSAIGSSLLAAGCNVRALGRNLDNGRLRLPGAEWVAGDLRRLTTEGSWRELVTGCEAVINASGALQSGLRDNLLAVQEEAIIALIGAAKSAGVARFVQVSAAGAGEQPGEFMATKARADAALAASGLPHAILRPGLVIGRNAFGGSELLRMVAGLPLIRPEIEGAGPIQCIALGDVVTAVVRALDGTEGEFDLVERESRSLGDIVGLHREWLALPPARWIPRVPLGALRPVALLADGLGWLGWRSPLRSNAIAVLAGRVGGDVDQARVALGREPLSLPEALAAVGQAGKADRWHARLSALYPLALAALFVLWLAGGLVGLSHLDAATTLLEGGGLAAGNAQAIVLAGSLADLAIAGGILFRPALKPALGGGALLASGYALGAAVVRPDLWLDPLGAMVKVVPIVVLSLMCLAMAEER